MGNAFLSSIGFLILGLAIGGGLGFFFTRRYFEKQLKEHPPVNDTQSDKQLSFYRRGVGN